MNLRRAACWCVLAVGVACGEESAKAPDRTPDDAGSLTHEAGSGGSSSAAAGVGGSGSLEPSAGGSTAPDAGAGGVPGSAGADAPESGAPAAAGSEAGKDCAFSVSASVSEYIPTVGIVEWSLAGVDVEGARIEFGLDTSYGMTAPVSLAEPGHRTLLLGMKAAHTYHFRIVTSGRKVACQSADQTLVTGELENALPKPSVQRSGARKGFFLSSFLLDGPAFVLDEDGDYVWWAGSGPMGRAALSHDGEHLWYSAVNVAGGTPSLKRITLDGATEDDFTAEVGDIHHDFTLLPDDTVALLAHAGYTDDLIERSPDGTLRHVANVGEALGGVANTHANSVHYWPSDDTYTVSDLESSTILKLTRDGQVVWIVGGTPSSFSGDTSWKGQHGHQLIGPDHLLFFNNGPLSGPSSAVELTLDLTRLTATRTWEYGAAEHCPIYGDVQRLADDTTLVTYSTTGIARIVNAAGDAEWELSFDLGGAMGYATWLDSLYPQP